MSIDINSILSPFDKYATVAKNKTTQKSNIQVDDNIFAQASAMVAEYKKQLSENKNTNTSAKNGLFSQLSFTEIANMSTKDFLQYAYDNKSTSGYKDSNTDSSEIELPFLVSYQTKSVSSAGKSFMQVVASLHAEFPFDSEEQIAAELLARYGNTNTNKNTTGGSLNMSA